MAVRFVELVGLQERMFAFCDDDDNHRLVPIGVSFAWRTWSEVLESIVFTPFPVGIDMLEAQCPPWVFGNAEPPRDIPELMRVASDLVKSPDHDEAMGVALADAAATIEADLAWLRRENERLREQVERLPDPVPRRLTDEEIRAPSLTLDEVRHGIRNRRPSP